MKPSVSIIIPTRNRPAILAQCLAALPSGVRGLEPLEILVVDDGSNEETRKVVDQFCRSSEGPAHYVRQEHPRGANAARNAGLQLARGEIVVFIDDDVFVTEGWLSKLVAGLSERYPVVSGAVRLSLDGPLFGKHRQEISGYLSEVLGPPHGSRGEIVSVACNMAAYRWVFDRARFDDSVRPPVEENDWLERAGVRAGFVPQAWVWHHKTPKALKTREILLEVWRRGSEGGWWLRERLKVPARKRWALAMRSLRTTMRAFGHALLRRCWGGVAIGLGELSKALALAGVVNRGPRAPESWR